MSYTGNLGTKVINKEDAKKKIAEEEDFIKCPRFKDSLKAFLSKSQIEEIDDKVIARLLLIEEADVQKIYDEAIKSIKEGLGEK